LREEEIYFDTGGGDYEGMRQSGLRVCKDGAQLSGTGKGLPCSYTIRMVYRDALSDVSTTKLPLVKLPVVDIPDSAILSELVFCEKRIFSRFMKIDSVDNLPLDFTSPIEM